MNFKLLLVFYLVDYLRAQQSSICSYENNIDYSQSVTSTYLYSTSAQLCCTLCGYKAECIGFSFQSGSGMCFLKSSINLQSRAFTNGRISGSNHCLSLLLVRCFFFL